jgi:Mlc titration factor MtfA (ptsG expression regulator)
MVLGVILFAVVAVIVYFKWNTTKETGFDASEFLPSWRLILTENVAFYNSLDETGKTQFEADVLYFLSHTRITGIDTSIDDTDRILVASSAVIPIFAFPQWHYTTISEVLLYPNAFNANFETAGQERMIMGMVGDGPMNGTMILSKQALRVGFSNDTDKNNTAIHEFIHLIDKMDGATDGIPENLLDKKYALPWIDLIRKEIDLIKKRKSDINPYGATSQTEFFAVAGEYFFERPEQLKASHPELYELMAQVFQQDMTLKKLSDTKKRIGRNDPCHCGKGEKFKHCCGAVHYTK